MQNLFVGVEIGATKQQIALGDEEGNLLYVLKEKVVIRSGAKDILEWLERKMPLMIDKEREYCGKVRSITVGFGGIVHSATGQIVLSVQVDGWQGYKLQDWFETRYELPTRIVNDTVAGGYGELITGSGKTANTFFYTNIGSGIGGAIFFGRKYFDGQGLGAGYFGHTYVPNRFTDKPGEKIKVEDSCSGFAIERRLRKKGYISKNSMLLEICNGDIRKVTCRELGIAARRLDSFASAEIKKIAWSFSVGLSNLITLLAPDVISIGGGVSNLGDVLLAPIRKYTNELVFASCKDKFKIVQCKHLDNAVLIGAVLFAKHILSETDKALN